jgi:hypothetical protein
MEEMDSTIMEEDTVAVDSAEDKAMDSTTMEEDTVAEAEAEKMVASEEIRVVSEVMDSEEIRVVLEEIRVVSEVMDLEEIKVVLEEIRVVSEVMDSAEMEDSDIIIIIITDITEVDSAVAVADLKVKKKNRPTKQ